MKHAIILFALVLASALPAAAETISGRIQIKDADSAYVDGREIRLHGVDAPEWGQACTLGDDAAWMAGQEATAWAKSFVGDSWASCTVVDRDRYGRFVATCMIDGQDLSASLVRAGWAMAYRRYSTRYVGAENEAKRAGRGIWAGQCAEPWNWRKEQRK